MYLIAVTRTLMTISTTRIDVTTQSAIHTWRRGR
jgi:hypothetical protein